ncbi:uncharacterized protein SPSK_06055 [Sporothrix schenckii 1099-18]|uniref:Uncharacterized protein n=2 Tax=Sporothrix schenckii TaxID=29908 RepID=U7PSA0_SPOS1|nr:uncharacterized protein SPSK_06055 [Sporothrix schenckii 1099-18]ERS98457.1 hypothetical protein HMPREF1624_05241 [Sporothrix schenckii ATCC 58251]KJR89393.1 hypothetical protein SPSK_06055 [Sporothrix schenckii 1099-18]
MVYSSAPQLASTYRLWHQFTMPIDGGQRLAISVPSYVADQLSSAYTIMVTSMIVNVWCICFALGFFYIMRHNHELGSLSSNLWNKRASMSDSLLSLMQKQASHWKRWWVYPAIGIIVGCWVAETVLSIIIPPYIFIDTAAPVNIDSIVVPPNSGTSDSATAQLFSLDVPAALRAVGGALVAASDVTERVTISQRDIGTTAKFEPIQEIDYSYYVTGYDLGLQHQSTLQLNVQGSCRTEYGWLVSSDNSSGYTNDTYAIMGDAAANGHISLSLYDGPSPTAFFYTGEDGPGIGNTTYAAFISSVDRVSFTPGTDALYYTGSSEQQDSFLADTDYIVQPGRPVLSCWESNVWSFNGANSSVIGLNNTALPGLNLPLALQLIFARYLGAPRIESIGTELGLGALQSSTLALGTIFDAGSSSAFSDLQRLVLAAFIATANTLTDTTLASSYLGSKTAAGNMIYGDNNEPLSGADEFVVWSSDVSTISVRAAIIIPVVAFASWLLVFFVLKFTPLASVNTLDILELQKNIYEKYPDADLTMYDEATWQVQMRLPLVGERRLPWANWGTSANTTNRRQDDVEVGYQAPAQPTYAASGDAEKQEHANAVHAVTALATPGAPFPDSNGHYSAPEQPVYAAAEPSKTSYSTTVESTLASQEHEVAAAVAREEAAKPEQVSKEIPEV